MLKKVIILCSFLFVLGGCQKMTSSQEATISHPVIGKWAEVGKCESLPWIFKPYTVRWGQNNGVWEEEKGKVRIRAHMDQDNAVMVIYLTYPQNNRMSILSAEYGESYIRNLKGQLVKCS